MADDVVRDVLIELRGRKGFRHMLETIEDEDAKTFDEMVSALHKTVVAVLDSFDIVEKG